jgi:hypothetical protein
LSTVRAPQPHFEKPPDNVTLARKVSALGEVARQLLGKDHWRGTRVTLRESCLERRKKHPFARKTEA